MHRLHFMREGLSFRRHTVKDKLESSGLASDRQSHKKAVIDLHKCTLCGACVDVCKFKAIVLEKTPATCAIPDIKGYKGVWVFIEQKKGRVQSVSYELLGKARELGEQTKLPGARGFDRQ